MNDDESHSLAPSGSTNATLLAGAVAAILMAILEKFGITFRAGFESAIAVLLAAAAGYLPKSGRRKREQP